MINRLGIVVLLLLGISLSLCADVWVLTIDGEIGRGSATYVRRGVADAEEARATAIILVLSTPGGYLDAAVTIRDQLLDTTIRTIAYVDREAFSAGALLALACDSIYMAPGGVIGAATPVVIEGTNVVTASEKEIAATRSLFAATAEATGKPADLAEAMVDPDIVVPDVIEADKLLSLTTQEAVTLGIAVAEAGTLEAVLADEGLAAETTLRFQSRVVDQIVDTLTIPWLAAVLITVGLVGLFIEMLIPGIGVFGIVGTLCLAAFFWANFLVGLAGWESIAFVLGGFFAVILEVFAFTAVDFGLAGLAGLVLIGLGFYTAMTGPFTRSQDALTAVAAVIGGVFVTIVVVVILLARLPKTRLRFGGVILPTAITGRAFSKRGQGGADSSGPGWVGQEGVAATDLRPVGAGLFGTQRIDVICEEGFLEKGTPIVITRDEGYRKAVQKREIS
ncbi:hypothetical protein JW848_04600 [Candidatus Bipolaricaulota bacterium]|nr:hypothetical protein [Candidatus Bipolaricaulota bacterium]